MERLLPGVEGEGWRKWEMLVKGCKTSFMLEMFNYVNKFPFIAVVFCHL